MMTTTPVLLTVLALLLPPAKLPAATPAKLPPATPPDLRSATCGAIVPGEAGAFEFYERALPRYSAGVAAATAPMRARLQQWETACDGTALRVAVQDLRNLAGRTRDRADRTYVQALLATALSRGPEVRVPHSHGGLFLAARRSSNTEREARRLFDDVLQRWPAEEIAAEYATLAIATRDRSTLESADRALARMTQGEASAELRALHALLVALRKELPRAVRLVQGLDAQSVRAVRLQSIVLLLADVDIKRATTQYFAALERAQPAELELFYDDLWPLLNDAEQDRWATLAHAERASWLRAEWEWRASQSSRTLAERLRIHFERAVHAMDWYPRQSFRGAAGWEGEERLILERESGRPFDDRGLIYIRHGAPDEVRRSATGGVPKEAWLYHHLNTTPGAGLFEFKQPETTVDWVAVAPEPCDPDRYVGLPDRITRAKRPGGARVQISDAMSRMYVDWAMTLGEFDPARVGPALNCYTKTRGANTAAGLALLRSAQVMINVRDEDQRKRAQDRVTDALRTEFAAPPLERLYRGTLATYAFRSGGSATELLAFVGVPAGAITARDVAGAVEYAFTTTVAIEHPQERTVERRDSVLPLRLAARPLPEQSLRIGLSAPARPDTAAVVRVTVLNAHREGEGQVFVSRRPIPAFAGALSLSDIVVAEPRDGGTLARGAQRVSPLPGHYVARGAEFRIFHEAYGATAETPARVRITVAPIVDETLWSRLSSMLSEKLALDVEFDDVLEPDAAGVSYLTRDITAALEAGRYEVRVEVRTASASARRTTHITVVEPGS